MLCFIPALFSCHFGTKHPGTYCGLLQDIKDDYMWSVHYGSGFGSHGHTGNYLALKTKHSISEHILHTRFTIFVCTILLHCCSIGCVITGALLLLLVFCDVFYPTLIFCKKLSYQDGLVFTCWPLEKGTFWHIIGK